MGDLIFQYFSVRNTYFHNFIYIILSRKQSEKDLKPIALDELLSVYSVIVVSSSHTFRAGRKGIKETKTVQNNISETVIRFPRSFTGML